MKLSNLCKTQKSDDTDEDDDDRLILQVLQIASFIAILKSKEISLTIQHLKTHCIWCKFIALEANTRN